MFEHIRSEVEELVKSQPKAYANKLRFHYPQLRQWLVDTYGSHDEGLYRWLYNASVPMCKYCGSQPCQFNSIHNGGYRQYCSCSCRAKDKQSFRNAHNPDGSLKQSVRTKNSEKSEQSRKKACQTYLDKHQSDMYQDISARRHQQYTERVPKVLTDYEYCKAVQIPLWQLATNLDVPYGMVLKYFRQHGLSTANLAIPHASKAEVSICDYLDSLGVGYERNVRNLLPSRREIDIYIPDQKLGIEYCGLYWHSDRNGYPPRRHQEKYLEAKEHGIKLITLFEDEWINKQQIVKSRLQSLTGRNERIYARSCVVQVRPAKQVTDLLNQWHIAGSKNAIHNVCLMFNGEVVAVVTYGKPRYSTKEQIEIIRYATVPGKTIVGGFSRLMKHVIGITDATSIISYSDNRWGNGEVYAKSGMKCVHMTEPSYFYFIVSEGKRYHRSNFMKHKIVDKMGGNVELSEIENMRAFGYNRIFDCGTTKWIWTVD